MALFAAGNVSSSYTMVSFQPGVHYHGLNPAGDEQTTLNFSNGMTIKQRHSNKIIHTHSTNPISVCGPGEEVVKAAFPQNVQVYQKGQAGILTKDPDVPLQQGYTYRIQGTRYSQGGSTTTTWLKFQSKGCGVDNLYLLTCSPRTCHTSKSSTC